MAAIRAETVGAVHILTIENEPRRNAFTAAMSEALRAGLQAAEDDPAIRCVVITGGGDAAFSSGHDLREMLAHRNHASDADANACFVLPVTMRTPTIAAVNGHAVAGGLVLALSCDFRVACEGIHFAAPGSRLGLLPIGGQLSRLPTMLPRAVAHEMLVADRRLSAEDAHAFGFVTRVVPRGQARDAALKLAQRIARQSAPVVRDVKAAFGLLDRDGPEPTDAFAWRRARELQSTPDAIEGMNAFLDKREPRFCSD